MCKKEDFNKVGFCKYSVNNGVLSSSLYNGRIKFGEDTFEINGKKYYRLQGFSSEYYRKIDIGKSKELITNFSAKEISIPYTIINGLKDTKLNVSTTANWIKWIAVTEGTIVLSVDTSSENRSGTIRLSCLGAEDVVLELQQVSDYIINVEEEEIILDYHSSSQSIPYSIVNADSNKVLTAMCNADWIQDLVVTDDAVNFGVLENNDKGHTQRKAEIVLSYPEAEALTITVIQRFDQPVISVDINNENVGYMGGTIELTYSIANPRDTAVVGIVCNEEWFACSKCDEGVISLDIAENLYGRRKGSVLIKYTVDGTTIASKSLKIVQDHNPSCELHYETTDGKIISVKASSFGEDVTIEDHYISSDLATIVFNKPITQIGKRAFWSDDTMKSITIPYSVKTIGEDAFFYCSSLEEVYISDLSAWCRIDFANFDSNPLDNDAALYINGELATDITIPSDITQLKQYAFDSCDSLTSVTIGDSVTTIGEFAFSGCSSLTSVTIGDSVTAIGVYTFGMCTSLTSVTIGDSVKTIGTQVFTGCYSLEKVYISDLSAWCRIDFADDYGSSPLHGGAALYINGELATDITIPSDITQLKQYAFDSCDSLTSVTIGDSVTTIGEFAFSGCSSLTSVTIGDSVKTIGENAFYYCDSLTSVTIGDSVETIGENAFFACDSLTSVTIGDSVTYIGESAFFGCESLTSVYCKALTPPTGVFLTFDYNASGRKIYVPTGSVYAYKTAWGWSDYADDIVGYDF